MPFYEYLCGVCGHDLEVLQKISEEPLVYCPECGEKTLKKQISKAAFRLKGTGWYETDFKDGDKKKSADSSDTSQSSGKNSGADSKSDTGQSDSGKGKSSDSSDSKSSSSRDSSSNSTSESKSSSTSNAA